VTYEEQLQAVNELDERIERLRVLYDQYFLGFEKIEPMTPRKEVDRRVWMLRREQIKNTALRFRMQQLISRYNSFGTYWQRILREIENGTYKRDVVRAAKRFGVEPLTTMARKRFGKAALEKAALEAQEQKEKEKAAENVYDLEELLSEEDVQPVEIEPVRQKSKPPPFTKKPPPPVFTLDEEMDDLFAGLSPNEFSSENTYPTVPKFSQQRDTKQPLAAKASASPRISQTPPTASSAPAATGKDVRPRFSETPAKAASIPASTNLEISSEDDDLMKGLSASRPPIVVRKTIPNELLVSKDSKQASETSRTSKITIPDKPPRKIPYERPAAPMETTSNEGRTPFASSMVSSSTSRAPANPPEKQAPAPAPMPRSSLASSTSLSGWGKSTPPQPKEPARTEKPKVVEPPKREPAAPQATPTSALPNDRVKEIYNNYMKARKACNESTEMTMDKLAKNLDRSITQLQEKHAGKRIDFDVVIKNGKAVLKPVLKR
jgi:hypothetical protein